MEMIALLLIASVANAASQLLLKLSVRKFTSTKGDSQSRFYYLSTLAAGMILFAISLSTYIRALSENDISVAFPMMGATYVFVLILSHYMLGESISAARAIGAGFIIFGTSLIAAGSLEL